MGPFDWLKGIFRTLIPDIPPPFQWVSSYIREYIWNPVKRTLEETRHGWELIAGEISGMWTNRDWYFDRMRIKFRRVYAVVTTWIDQAKQAVLAQAANSFNIAVGWVTNTVTPLIQYAITLVNTAGAALQTFIQGTYASFVRAVNAAIANITVTLQVIKYSTQNALRFWQSVFTNYQAVVSGILADPPGYIMAWVRSRVDRYAEEAMHMVADILLRVW